METPIEMLTYVGHCISKLVMEQGLVHLAVVSSAKVNTVL